MSRRLEKSRHRRLRMEFLEERLALNAAPVAEIDSYTAGTIGDREITVGAEEGVLANDWDFDGDFLTAHLVSGPSHAAAFTLNADGSFEYTPQPGWAGQDQFTYEAWDTIDSGEATVYVWSPHLKAGVVQSDPALGDIDPSELTEQANADSGAGYWVFLNDGPVNFDVTIPFQVVGQIPPAPGEPPAAVTGYATLGIDYSLNANGSVTIPAGSSGKLIKLTVLPDKLVEGNEMAAIQLQYNAGTGSVFTFDGMEDFADLNIIDNDYWKWDDAPANFTTPNAPIDPAIGDVLDCWFDGDEIEWADSKFTAGSGNGLREDGLTIFLTAEWVWYERAYVVCGVKHEDYLSRTLKLDFDYEPVTGEIRPRDGSGIEGVSKRNVAVADIDWNYSIDNSGAYLKTAKVRIRQVAGVNATLSASSTGSVNAEGAVYGSGLSGGWQVTYTQSGDDGGTAIDQTKEFSFELRSTEDPEP